MNKTSWALRLTILVFTALLVLARPAVSQDANLIGEAIARTCGVTLDPATQGVLAGVVADSLTSMPLPNARVKIVWQGPDDPRANTATVDTDGQGFYAFCGVPGNVLVLLSATLRVSSPSRQVIIEAGMLMLENIVLPVSESGKPGMVVGRVIDAVSRAPVDGAAVKILGDDKTILTNSRGYFVIGERESGLYRIQVQHLAYADQEQPFHVAGNFTQNLEIEMTAAAIDLPGLTVTVAPSRYRRDLEGMISRMNMGFGQFITREVLESRPQSRISDLLRDLPGVLIFNQGMSAIAEVRGRACTPELFLDGMPYALDPEIGLNTRFFQEMEAIEVYKNSEIPGEFLQAGFQRPCMAIVAWSRRGG